MSLLPPRPPQAPIATPDKYLKSFEAICELSLYEAVCVYRGDEALEKAKNYSDFVNRWNKGRFKDSLETKLRTVKYGDLVLVLRVE